MVAPVTVIFSFHFLSIVLSERGVLFTDFSVDSIHYILIFINLSQPEAFSARKKKIENSHDY